MLLLHIARPVEQPVSYTHLFQADSPRGGNIAFGVREHAMGTILSGISLHGGLRPFGSTFFVFSDYMKPSLRLAALMGVPVTYRCV